MAKVSAHIKVKSEHVNAINVFHDVNSTLYTVTNIHPNHNHDLNYNVFPSENVALFTVASIPRIQKNTKNRNYGNRLTEDSRSQLQG